MSVRSTLNRFWLPASLALNVFLATTLVWHAVGRPPHHPPGGPGHFFVDVVAPRLPAADADLLRRNFAAHDAEIQAGDEAMQAATHRISAVVDSDSNDREALRTALDDSLSARQALDEKVTEILVDTLVHMSGEGRHRFALAMHPGGRDGRPPPEGSPPPDDKPAAQGEGH